MKQTKKRILAAALSLTLLASLFPALPWAAAAPDEEDQSSEMSTVSEPTPDEEASSESSFVSQIESVFVEFLTGDLSMKAGKSTKVEPVITGDDGSLKYSWESTDPSVAKVSGSGKKATITAVGAGETDIILIVNRSSDGDAAGDGIHVTVTADVKPVTVKASGTSLSMTEGKEQALSATVSGGSGNYSYIWDCSDNLAVTRENGASASVIARYPGQGNVSLTVMDENDHNNNATANWSVSVSEAEKPVQPVTVTLSNTSLSMSAGGSATLTATATGGSGDAAGFEYTWRSDNTNVATVSGSGRTVTVNTASTLLSGSKAAEITVYATDLATNVSSKPVSCVVSVANKTASFDTSATATVGTPMAVNGIATAIANQFRAKFGVQLDYSSSVRFNAPAGPIGSFRMQDGTPISANNSFTFATLQDMHFMASSTGSLTTGYSITNGANTLSGTITIKANGGNLITSAELNPSSITMDRYSSHFLKLNVNPGNTGHSVTWSSSNPDIVTVTGNGDSVTVISQGKSGPATITATIWSVDGSTIKRNCQVSVTQPESRDRDRNERTYDPSLTVTMGSDYYGNDVSNVMAKQWRSYFGYTLPDSATMKFSSTGTGRYGVIRLQNGTPIKANTTYTFDDWVRMYFQPYAAGTFQLPYNLSYGGSTLRGTINIYIRSSNLSATMNPSSLNMSTYSNQYIGLSITPRNAYYTVRWNSSNAGVVRVVGSGDSATVYSNGTTGTVTITATIIDGTGTEIYRSCNVTVNAPSAATYNPSVSTTLGVNYTGTGTSTAMATQFRSLYGDNINNNNARIRFSSTGNNQVGVMRLANGNAIRANTDYSFADYIAMYT